MSHASAVIPFLSATAAPSVSLLVARPSGLVRVNRRVLVDDRGPFAALGTTAFPLPFLFRHDRPRAERALATIAAAGVFDFVRTFTGVAGESWADRMLPLADVDAVMACADLAYGTYGVRLAHTIAADGKFDADFDTPAKRERVIDLYADAVQGHEEAFQSFEIVNENYDDGKVDINELRRLGQRLQARTRVPVILSAPGKPEDYLDMYSGVGLTLANMHGERKTNSPDGGRWEPLWKPYEFPWQVDGDARRGDATACAWLEPIGPGSSVDVEFNVERLVLHYVTTHLLGCTAHVLHCAAGIRLGGAWDRHRGIPAHLDETPGWAEIIAGLRAAKRYVPPDIGFWAMAAGHRDECPINFRLYRHGLPDGRLDNGPFDDGTLFKAAVASNGHAFMGIILRLQKPLTIAPKRACVLDVLDPLTGTPRSSHTLAADELLVLEPRTPSGWNWDGDGVVLTGTWR